MIKILLFFITFCIPVFSFSQQTPDNTFTNPRDNQTYRTITISRSVGMGVVHTHNWMAQNLNYDTQNKDSWCYKKRFKNCAQYGRLYTWEAAQKACPEGWRLPTDLDWQILAHQFSEGGLVNDERGEKAAYSALIENGSSGFAALLGGNRGSLGEHIGLGRFGYYWSATENDADYAWYYWFNGDDLRLDRNFILKSYGLACRCIKDN